MGQRLDCFHEKESRHGNNANSYSPRKTAQINKTKQKLPESHPTA